MSPGLAKALLDAKLRNAEIYRSSEADWRAWIAEVTRLGEKHPAFLSAVQASLDAKVVPVDLRVVGRVTIDDASRLDDVQRRQLQRVGQLWDGKDLPLSERIGRTPPREETEDENDSFSGSVEFRRIGNARGKHLYDVLLYANFFGTIFEAGTTTDIGFMGDQLGLKLHQDDVALRLGLTAVVGRVAPSVDENRQAPKAQSSAKKSPGPKAKSSTKKPTGPKVRRRTRTKR